jgi:hypothetical protein
VPVTAKLSREFYEKFGDKVVDELVALFNQVDTTYRTELRELNELNFARFDDKLERRLAEFRADLGSQLTALGSSSERRLGEADSKWERRLAELDGRWERRLAELDSKWEKRLAESDARSADRIGDLRAELIKWMFLFWLGTVASMMGFRVLAP